MPTGWICFLCLKNFLTHISVTLEAIRPGAGHGSIKWMNMIMFQATSSPLVHFLTWSSSLPNHAGAMWSSFRNPIHCEISQRYLPRLITMKPQFCFKNIFLIYPLLFISTVQTTMTPCLYQQQWLLDGLSASLLVTKPLPHVIAKGIFHQ